jgi:hypothetical protein
LGVKETSDKGKSSPLLDPQLSRKAVANSRLKAIQKLLQPSVRKLFNKRLLAYRVFSREPQPLFLAFKSH